MTFWPYINNRDGSVPYPFNVLIYFDLSRFYRSTELTLANYGSGFLHYSLCWQKPQMERKEIWSVYLFAVRQLQADVNVNGSRTILAAKIRTLESLTWLSLIVHEVRTLLTVIYSLSGQLTFCGSNNICLIAGDWLNSWYFHLSWLYYHLGYVKLQSQFDRRFKEGVQKSCIGRWTCELGRELYTI